jgi:hypothetical protein
MRAHTHAYTTLHSWRLGGRAQLLDQVEGMSLGNDGFVISVFTSGDQAPQLTMGTIEYDTGAANVICEYSAICFRYAHASVCERTHARVRTCTRSLAMVPRVRT